MTASRITQLRSLLMPNYLEKAAQLRSQMDVVLNRLRKPLSPTTGTVSRNGSSSIQARIAKLDQQGKPGPAHAVRLKEFDQRGIVFHHRQPFCDRRARVTLEGPDFGQVVAEVDLRWCRFTRTGQYTSGGRFVELIRKSA